MHNAANIVADAWRKLSRVVNEAIASDEVHGPASLNGSNDEGASAAARLDGSPPLERRTAVGAPPARDDAATTLGGIACQTQRGANGGVRRRSASPDARGPSSFVRHRVVVDSTWKPGDRVKVDVGGLDVDCLVPDGARPGDAFDVRIPRDRLPRLLCYQPHDFRDALTTVWTRDLERLNALLAAEDPDAPGRAAVLARAVLTAPLRDIRDYDHPTSSSLPRQRTLMPRAWYRGDLDEVAAQAAATKRDDTPVHVAAWRKPAEDDASSVGGAVNNVLHRKKRVPDLIVELSRRANNAAKDRPTRDWRLELRPGAQVYEALCKLSRTADGQGGSTIEADELHRALVTMGPNPLATPRSTRSSSSHDLPTASTSAMRSTLPTSRTSSQSRATTALRTATSQNGPVAGAAVVAAAPPSRSPLTRRRSKLSWSSCSRRNATRQITTPRTRVSEAPLLPRCHALG